MSKQKQIRILHVDDRAENRYIVSKILRNAGFQVIEGKTGREALQLAAEQPDLIILDVRLPDIIGYEVAKRIKSNPATSSIPIIQLSASFITDESKVQALDSGADQFLTQPVEGPVLIASVKALLRMRNAETISRLSAHQWQTTFDALSEGIGLLDNDQNILRCNRRMSELLALPYPEIEGRNCTEILNSAFGISRDRVKAFSLRQVFESRVGRQWFRTTIDPVVDYAGDPVGSILVIAEITDQKLAEEALMVTEKLAATGRLAHSIAHEINNPLSSITNVIFLLKHSLKSNPEAQEYLEIADAELLRVSLITKQTLSFHRDSSHPVKVSLSEIVDSALSIYSLQLKQKQIVVDKRFEAKGFVHAFPGQLRQVFSNMLANALDASIAKSKFTIHVYDSHSWRGTGSKGVRVVFSDTGKGISASDKTHLCEAFFTTKEQKGSGLGLWLSMAIINQHGGGISVRSRVTSPSGTCFSLFFPTAFAFEENLPIDVGSQSP
ncbi:MAG: multi-sensor signal transduction histidine kinase [Acidobacteriales bacterium]|nr:multi-sensor signal transduction histidine kinase [Terriglobales bacterium]